MQSNYNSNYVNKNRPTQSSVKMCVKYGNGCLITKEDRSALIVLKQYNDSYLLAIIDMELKMPDGLPFIMWSKKFKESLSPNSKMSYIDAAYQKYLYLVGKMCKKDIDSKYFLSHKLNDHKVNGNTGDLSRDDYECIANYAEVVYKTLNLQ